MDVTATQATLIAALLAVGGVVTGAILTFVSNVGVRQQGIREAELLGKLRELKMNEEASAVERLLRLRVARWATRSRRSIATAVQLTIVVGLISLVTLAVIAIQVLAGAPVGSTNSFGGLVHQLWRSAAIKALVIIEVICLLAGLVLILVGRSHMRTRALL